MKKINGKIDRRIKVITLVQLNNFYRWYHVMKISEDRKRFKVSGLRDEYENGDITKFTNKMNDEEVCIGLKILQEKFSSLEK